MKTAKDERKTELIELSLRHSTDVPLSPTSIPELVIARSAVTGARVHSVLRPSLCFIAQGAKEVTVAGRIHRYGVGQHLVSTVDLPSTGEVIVATPREPYLCLAISLEPAIVYDLVKDLGPPPRAGAAVQGAMSVGEGDPEMSDAVLRLARCLDRPSDCAILAPSILREIVYRLLQSDLGAMVRDVGVVGSRTQRIARAIEHIKTAFMQPMRVDELASMVGMSPSTFHLHFKQVTTLSPLQYQKQLRLQEARRLLISDASSAADVAFRVGYESPSQFSREYTRLFGLPPISDARRWRETHS